MATPDESSYKNIQFIVWASANLFTILYGIVLYIYMKKFRKNEILSEVRN
jgi:hypothetical protein